MFLGSRLGGMLSAPIALPRVIVSTVTPAAGADVGAGVDSGFGASSFLPQAFSARISAASMPRMYILRIGIPLFELKKSTRQSGGILSFWPG